MTTNVEAVLVQALQLTPDERAELIEALADTILPAPALHPEWEAEIARRVAEMDAGKTRFIPADEVLEALANRIRVSRGRE